MQIALFVSVIALQFFWQGVVENGGVPQGCARIGCDRHRGHGHQPLDLRKRTGEIRVVDTKRVVFLDGSVVLWLDFWRRGSCPMHAICLSSMDFWPFASGSSSCRHGAQALGREGLRRVRCRVRSSSRAALRSTAGQATGLFQALCHPHRWA